MLKLLLKISSLRSWAECRAIFVHRLITLAIHLKLLMQPIVLIGGAVTLLGYKFNNINDETNNLMVTNDNWELIQLGMLFLKSYPSNMPTTPTKTIGCISNLRWMTKIINL